MEQLELDIERPIEFDITPQTVSVDIAVVPGEVAAIIAVPGEPGQQGAKGDKGVDGTTTFAGTWLWWGEGPPGTIVGSKVGDAYFDTLTGTTYKLGD